MSKTNKADEAKLQRKKMMYEAMKADPDLKGFPAKKRWFLFCLKLAKGLAAIACQNAELSRRTFYDWYSKEKNKKPNPTYDQKFADMVDEIRQTTHEWVESKLLQNIDNNDERAIEYYLSNNYKEKYTQVSSKVDVTSGGEKIEGIPQFVFLSADQMSPEEIEQYKRQHLHQHVDSND